MRITIDYTPALRQSAGIGRYTRNLVDALAEIDRTNRYTLFCAGSAPERHDWPANFTVRVSPVPSRWLTAGWHKLRLPFPAELLAGNSDLFHSPDFTLPPLARARGVVTIHDLSFMRLPHVADPGLREHLMRSVPPAVARAAHILADSENTKRDVIELLGAEAERITVVPGGVEERFRRVSDPEVLTSVRSRYALPESFVLFVGTLEPRKNLPRLISAFAELKQRTSLPHKLVIAGKPGWLYEDIYRQVETESLDGAVQFIGYTKDEDLPALYSLAALLAFPSLYEGFGLPPLEAMACGTPVVCANNSSLPEAVDDAALLTQAEDVHGLAEAMGRVLSDAALRGQLSERGLARAARFTWRAAAGQLVEAYGKAAEVRK